MNVVILAGGYGTRIAEETSTRPKPMVEVGGRPILWHIMNIYAHHGFNDFVIACGYKAEVIKEYFHTFYYRNSDIAVNTRDGSITSLGGSVPDWRVKAVDTGLDTMTGGRLRRLRHLTGRTFMATYGDAVANVDIRRLLDFHRAHGRIATLTAVRPPARFGGLDLQGDKVANFSEKPQLGEGWINGGFFVFEDTIHDHIRDDASVLERETMETLAAKGELMAYRHDSFWQPMDTLREKLLLEKLWETGNAPWKVW